MEQITKPFGLRIEIEHVAVEPTQYRRRCIYEEYHAVTRSGLVAQLRSLADRIETRDLSLAIEEG
jgi:hypothetical protein